MRFCKVVVLAVMVFVIMVGVSFAEGTYDGAIDGKEITITFNPGPFGPGEAGTVIIWYDKLGYKYEYIAYPVVLYVVPNLCSFTDQNGVLEAYTNLGIQLSKRE
jgi:hypothetical protein